MVSSLLFSWVRVHVGVTRRSLRNLGSVSVPRAVDAAVMTTDISAGVGWNAILNGG
jgi:hypothetical protein